MTKSLKKSSNLLPEFLRSDKNVKFLSSTFDQFIQTPQLERIDGFVGTKLTPNYNPSSDFYISQSSPIRSNYALEPALVFRDENSKIKDVISFDDIVNELRINGSDIDNLDTLLRTDYYSFDPPIDWDKLVNYDQYYWLINGPDPILINNTSTDILTTIIGQESYLIQTGYNLSNGMKVVFSNSTSSSEVSIIAGREYIVEGVGNSITLVPFDELQSFEQMVTVYDEKFDSEAFDDWPFDSDKKLPIVHDYITINKASRDLNPWTRYNRWFHRDIIKASAEINRSIPVFSETKRAKRPIIEFRANLQLFNFGNNGIGGIDVIDDNTVLVDEIVQGSFGYYVDEVLLEDGMKVIFNAARDPQIKGKIFRVEFDYSTTSPTINLIEDATPSHRDSVSVKSGEKFKGTTWYYDEGDQNWIFAQQHTEVNQPPLFDLFDSSGISYKELGIINSFQGSKLFGYDVGTGSRDTILGFPLKYQNSIGVGSYLFKNYFMTDKISVTVNNQSSEIPTAITYFKFNDTNSVSNIWKNAEEYRIPILEFQLASANTTTLFVESLDIVSTSTTLLAFVNDKKVDVSLNFSSKIEVNFENEIKINDRVLFKITADQTPNDKGYYETPLSLSNNPLNGNIENMTLSELSDHVFSMTSRDPRFQGSFPGPGNLKDLNNYARYGNRFIISSNPISFTQIFLGKKDHNVIDAIRFAADQYNQFKMAFLSQLVNVNSDISPKDAVDIIVKELNKNKDLKSAHYRSDMLPYGQDKIVREFVVDFNLSSVFPIGGEFSITELSFKSVLVYLNGTQQVVGVDYDINSIDESIEFLKDLSINDNIEIHYYTDTLGSYVPSTPTKLGLYPKYVPILFSDSSFIESTHSMIQCHDGSVIKAYGDYRDNIILEFERRIYNNIKVSYNSELFDMMSIFPGAFRESSLTVNSAKDKLQKDFLKWSGTYSVDASTNTVYNELNPFTWNYKNGLLRTLEKSVTGYWRGIYKYLYDTDQPDLRPWEMLGIIKKPAWWDTHYSWTNPLKRANLLTALENGYTEEYPSIVSNSRYARPNISEFAPVNLLGNLVSPDSFLKGPISYSDRKAKWETYDHSPAETAWRRSSYWPFVVNILAALTDPTRYTSKMYDVSRTSYNILNQLTYTQDDLYLSPTKLLIDSVDDAQTSGYSNFIVEKGRQRDVNYVSKLQEDLQYINFNLFHKLGGYTSKEKLQIIIDSVDPTTKGLGAILPLEDYSLILNVSNPIQTDSISGIVIQKLNQKYIVKGYDRAEPWFNILKPVKTASSGGITVGGVSSPFVDWNDVTVNGNKGLNNIDTATASSTNARYYRQGQIVRYNNRFYRVKVGHNAQSTFDPDLFASLPFLPVKGGATVSLPAKFENTVTRISYGTEFSSIQEVYDFIRGYGAYLESRGFIFDRYNSDLNSPIDWSFSGKEFLFWSTQNWSDNSIITLSPFAEYLKYSYPNSIVDDISGRSYEYSLMKADGTFLSIDNFKISREDGICTIETYDTDEGLFFAKLHSVQKEQGMVFNNSTIFNDTIYDIETGYRQRRLRLSGFRTKNWNGDLFSPGFVYDSVEINDWQPYKSYFPGEVVRFNGVYYESLIKIIGGASFEFKEWVKLPDRPIPDLLPNFDYKITQFEDFYSLDIDNFDAGQQKLAQHLIGYTPRKYLDDIFTNPITQYKFYQGFIKDKGTLNAIDKLSKARLYNNQGSIDIKEDWAFRIGAFGAFSSYKEIEATLNEGSSLENPYILKFVDTLPDDVDPLINYATKNNLLLKPDDYITSSTFQAYPSTFDDNNIELLVAGYVRQDDIDYTSYNKNSLLDIANNESLQKDQTIWLGFLENGGWDVYRYTKQSAKIAGVFVSSPGTEITFVTDVFHNLSIGDLISVVRFNSQVDGIHKVISIPSINQFVVASELSTITNDELLAYGTLYRFESARKTNFHEWSETKNLLRLTEGSKVWIDRGSHSRWEVYQKQQNYTGTFYISAGINAGQRLGENFYASDLTDLVLVSLPGFRSPGQPNIGKVWVSRSNTDGDLEKQFEYYLNSGSLTYCEPNTATEFGYSVTIDINKNLYFAGAPRASLIRAETNTSFLVLSTGTGTVRTFDDEGLVKISKKNPSIMAEYTEAVVAFPYSTQYDTGDHARFGNSLYINNVESTSSTLLLVGAPGTEGYSNTGSVFAYLVNLSTNTYTLPYGTGITVGGAKVASVIVGALTTSTSSVYVAFTDPQLENGTTATGVAIKTGLTVTSVVITDPGSGYLYPPSVVFSLDPGDPGTVGTAVTTLYDGAHVSSHPSKFLVGNGAGVSSFVLSTSSITDAVGPVNVYIAPPDLPGGIRARAVAVKTGTTVTSITVINPGSGYSIPPSVAIVAPTGTTGTAVSVLNDSPISLGIGSKFGHAMSGDREGNRIAISAPGYVSPTGLKGVVQIFDKDLNFYQSIISPLPIDQEFGTDVCMSPSGEYLFISSIEARFTGVEPYGKVGVWRLNEDDRYELYQVINNPLTKLDLKFGHSISISDDEKTLVISALGTNRSQPTTFDLHKGETTFDGGTTQFHGAVPDSGNVYVYSNFGGYFVESEELSEIHIYPGSRYGTKVISTNDKIYVGAPSYISLGIDTISLSTTTITVDISRSITIQFSGPEILPGFTPSVRPVYGNYTPTTKDIVGLEIINKGLGYLNKPIALAKDELGNTVDTLIVTIEQDKSQIYQFDKIDDTIFGWKLLRNQVDTVETQSIRKISLIDSYKEEVVDYLDMFDPLKGKIPGIAEQELKYKAAFDPAIYTIGISSTVVDDKANWLDEHVGELWWDLSTAKYVWYEQGDDVYRKNNWGKLFPGANIDVYEWVKTDLLPTQWAAQADTNDGLTNGISGQPKYPDNSVVSVKQVFNNVTGAFENVYYYWVKNKATIPNNPNRRLSSFQVASAIADPASFGLKFVEILSADSIALANVQPTLIDNRISVSIVFDNINNINQNHTEWLLLEEGNERSIPNTLLEKKLIDSFLGHDDQGNAVPDVSLSVRNRYGLGIRPQQTLFKNRFEALRNAVDFANSILMQNRITDTRSFRNLNKFEEIPDEFLRDYDRIVDDIDQLAEVRTQQFKQASLLCFVYNGQIRNVVITDPGFGYLLPPKVTIEGNSTAEILTEIDPSGRVVTATVSNPGKGFEEAPLLTVRPHTVYVSSNIDYSNKWSKHEFNYELRTWVRVKTQTYNTPLYWKYVDWVSADYNQYKDFKYVISDTYELESLTDLVSGDYVKVKNIGQGRSAVLEKLNDAEVGNYSVGFDILFSERGTIQILDSIWNYGTGYDINTLEENLYDEIPDIELYYVLEALKKDIFVDDLKVNWNLLFFKSVRYAMTEQKLLDWAFKTSFINVKNEIGKLDQRPVYKLDNEKAFEDYLREVKPYHTTIRNFTSLYTYGSDGEELVNAHVTDFDLPSYFDAVSEKFETVELSDPLISEYPWKDWADNYTYGVTEILVADPGSGYTQQPTVTVLGGGPLVTSTATAEAYIRHGGIYKIEVTNTGSGYTHYPIISISGGGDYVTRNATASAVLGNSPVRNNTIGIKFDRLTTDNEIGNRTVTETFRCDGVTIDFVLTWLAEPDKINITPLLDGKLIYATDYTIEYYKEEFNGRDKLYSKFVFLKQIPKEFQVFKITYNKHISLYRAIDRIDNFYNPTETMPGKELPLLMYGAEYPQTLVEALKFNDSSAWGLSEGYDSTAWEDIVEYYTKAKVVSTATVTSNILYLNDVSGIYPGQTINLLNTTTNLRTDTVVVSVNTSVNSITISNPSYMIKRMKANALTTGSPITVETVGLFKGDIRQNDIAVISGMSASGFNGRYTVDEILGNNKFSITSVGTLSTTTAHGSSTSTINVSSILSNIDAKNVFLDSYLFTSTNTSTARIVTHSALNDVSRHVVSITTASTSYISTVSSLGVFYSVIEDYFINGRALIEIYNLNTQTTSTILVSLYGDPSIEFWKNDVDPAAINTKISGGTINNPFNDATGELAEEFILDGDSFLNENSSFAPEECIPGHVLDSVGINVYTRKEDSSAIIFTGGYGIALRNTGTITSTELGVLPDATAGVLVSFNGRKLDRLLPDDFDAAEGPYFNPTDALPSGEVGSPIASEAGDDTFTGPYPLGFQWNMFGTIFTEVYVGTNGFLTFGGGDSEYTPLDISALEHPAIFVMYCDLWQDNGVSGQPLSTGETPGLFLSNGVIGAFNYWRLRFVGSHYNTRNNTPTIPAYQYEVTLYSDGTNQYVEMIYENTWRSVNFNGDLGFVTGIATANALGQAVSVPWQNIPDNSSHVFYSTYGGGNWQYAGRGRFDLNRAPYQFSNNNQFYIDGSTLYVAPQTTPGRVGYSIITVGGEDVIDGGSVVAENDEVVLIQSLSSIDDVRSAYVLVDGQEINAITTTTDYGYILGPTSSINNRASVRVYNIPTRKATVEAWFFEKLYNRFSRVIEEYFEVGSPQSAFTLTRPVATLEPFSAQAIVELSITSEEQEIRRRLAPPWTTYWRSTDKQEYFPVIDNSRYAGNLDASVYNINNIRVYVNGVKFRHGFDYLLDFDYIKMTSGIMNDGDVVAIEVLLNHDYVITENQLILTTPAEDASLKVTTFTDHDNLNIRTERFYYDYNRRFTLQRAPISDNYVWVSVNGAWLTPRYDYYILENGRTIELSEFYVARPGDPVVITTVATPSYGDTILGFRIFKDMFEKSTYHRIAKSHTTVLTQPLQANDTVIHVKDASRLTPPNPQKNKPGIIIVDAERIEWLSKEGNTKLTQLRRSTLGTGPALYSAPETQVIDQTQPQVIPYTEYEYRQYITATNTVSYIINTVDYNTGSGRMSDGITLTTGIDAVNQVEVYYGGRKLRKTPLEVHDTSIAYDSTSSIVINGVLTSTNIVLPPEFYITTSTQELHLNITEEISSGTMITIVKKEGIIWTGTESLLTSDRIQARFLREREAELPDAFYYGGDPALTQDNNVPLTDDDDVPLEGY